MIYQQFQQTPFQPRMSGFRPWLALAISVALVCLSLFLLPFVLLFGAIALGSLVLFSRLYVTRQRAKMNRARAQYTAESSAGSVVRESNAAHYQGRTFEHQND